MNEVLLAMAAGFIVGLLFSFLKLPIPAPPVLSGVMGIVGSIWGHCLLLDTDPLLLLSAFQYRICRV
jgi:XapX domain-containing protein